MNLKEKDAWRLLRQCFHFSIKEEFLWFVTGIIENFQLGEWSVGSLTPSKALCDPIRWLKVGLSKPNKACELRCFAWGKPLALILNPWKNNLHAVYWSIVLTWNSFLFTCCLLPLASSVKPEELSLFTLCFLASCSSWLNPSYPASPPIVSMVIQVMQIPGLDVFQSFCHLPLAAFDSGGQFLLPQTFPPLPSVTAFFSVPATLDTPQPPFWAHLPLSSYSLPVHTFSHHHNFLPSQSPRVCGFSNFFCDKTLKCVSALLCLTLPAW